MQLGVLESRAIREKKLEECAINRIHCGFAVFMPGRIAITAKWAKILPVIGPLLGTFWGLFTRDLTESCCPIDDLHLFRYARYVSAAKRLQRGVGGGIYVVRYMSEKGRGRGRGVACK